MEDCVFDFLGVGCVLSRDAAQVGCDTLRHGASYYQWKIQPGTLVPSNDGQK